MEPLSLFLATYVPPVGAHGNIYGYALMNSKIREYASKIINLNPESKNVLFMATPEIFDPNVSGKRIFLFTMFEGFNMPEVFVKNIQKADYLIVPSKWVKELFAKYFDSEKIFVVPLGVEDAFKYHERKVHPKHFRFLWVGAPNPRKGFAEVTAIWQSLGLDKQPSIELYLKTTMIHKEGIQQYRNVILDYRNLSQRDLIDLYHSAHCFVFPTHGEGFALTLAEALATGLPCIATNFSGLTEFFDEKVGYPISYELGGSNVMSAIHGNMGDIQVAYPNVKEIAEKMFWVKENYKKALVKGKLGSIRIRSKFTWENSAKALVDTIKGVDYGSVCTG